MNRRQKIIVSVTGIFIVLLLLVGLTYAYFLTQVTGNTNDKSISVSTANLALVYENDDGSIIGEGETIIPGKTFEPKTFTVTNQGNATTDYVVVIEILEGTSTFESNDFTYTLTCTSGCNGVNTATTFPINGGILVGNRIDVGETQTYSFTLTYEETGKNQTNDMNKTLNARINIKDITSINPYSDNPNTLAYNIINNAVLSKTGTTLVSVPETKPAVSVSDSTGTGEYELVTMSTAMMPYGFSPWLYADTEEAASSGSIVGSAKCSDLIGKYIYDRSSTINGVVKIESCEGEIPVISQEVMNYENVLTITQDDLGTSYYYRGQVEDNYVDFNGMCWRIVRIEGDGAIKLVLEDKDSTCATSNGNWDIGTGHYGYNYTKVTNSSGQQSSSSKYVADYLNSPTNTSTSMKSQFDAWLISTSIDSSKLKKDIWCLGNTTVPYDNSGTLLTSSVNDLMYNNTSFYYDAYRRLYGVGTTTNATLRCDGKNYETHESYIGTLTADEVVFAGGIAGTPNANYYLNFSASAKSWWTLSLSYFGGTDYFVFVFEKTGSVGYMGYRVFDDAISLRPAVTLASSAVITRGNGTKISPYVIQ